MASWRSWSTLVQIMACCFTAPSHHQHQCWLIISEVPWHSSGGNIIRGSKDSNIISKTGLKIILSKSHPHPCITRQVKWLFPYLSFPRIGDSPMMTEARADFTCWLPSETSSFTHGRILVMMICSRDSGERFEQNSGNFHRRNQQVI